MRSLVDGVRQARGDLDVREAFVDVQDPSVADAVADALGEDPAATAVVVPLLLSEGYHVRVDIANAVAPHHGRAIAAAPLGSDPRVVDVLIKRLAEANALPGDAVVLAAAGSSDPQALAAIGSVEAVLAGVHRGPVSVGFGSAAEPRVPAAVAAARDAGAPRVVVATYLLAPGHFFSWLAESGADVVAAPLCPDLSLVDVVLDHYCAAARRLTGAHTDRAGW